MATEDAGDYGGTCDTCANGIAKAGHLQCAACERIAADGDEHADAITLAIRVLEDHQWTQQTQSRRERELGFPDLADLCDGRAVLLQRVIDKLDREREG